MANINREYIRIYNKVDTVSVNEVEGIITKVKEEGLINYGHLEYSLNEKENCYDLAYNAKRVSNYLYEQMSASNYDVWIINSNEGGSYDTLYSPTDDNVNIMNKPPLIYCFDSFRIMGNPDEINDVIKEIFWTVPPAILKKDSQSLTYKLTGYYQSNNYVGQKGENNDPLRVNQNEFIKLRDCAEMSQIISNNYFNFYTAIYKRTNSPGDRINENIYSFDFLYSNRLVHRIKWTNENNFGYWIHESSEWFDNCKSPEWIEFNERKKAHNNR